MPSKGTLLKHSTPESARGIINSLIQGVNLSRDLPRCQRSGKEPMMGSLMASHRRANRNRPAIHFASMPRQ